MPEELYLTSGDCVKNRILCAMAAIDEHVVTCKYDMFDIINACSEFIDTRFGKETGKKLLKNIKHDAQVWADSCKQENSVESDYAKSLLDTENITESYLKMCMQYIKNIMDYSMPTCCK